MCGVDITLVLCYNLIMFKDRQIIPILDYFGQKARLD